MSGSKNKVKLKSPHRDYFTLLCLGTGMGSNFLSRLVGSFLLEKSLTKFKKKIMKEYYDILGVKYNASEGEIKSVFKKLAKIYHPDMLGTGNEELFKKINGAYKKIEENNFIFSDDNSFEGKENNHYENQRGDNSKEHYHNITTGIIEGLFDGFLNILKKILSLPVKLILFIWSLISRIYQRYSGWIILFIIIYPVGIIFFIWEFFRRKENIRDWKKKKKETEERRQKNY